MRIKVQIAILVGIIGFSLPAFAGTVITNHLPANTAIVNISARADGSAGYNGDQSLWYQPFNTGGAGSLLRYTVQPGTYGFRVVDPVDAAALYPALTSAETNQIYTAWTFNSPWLTDYLVFDNSASTNNSIPQLFDGAYWNTNGVTWTFYSSPTAAYTAAITNKFYNLLRTATTGGRNSTNHLTSYTFASATTLIFVIPDNILSDNTGGVSVLISPTILRVNLNIGLSGNSVVLQWPTNASGFTLAQKTNLQNGAWSDVPQSPLVVNTNFSVTLPRDLSTNRFFILHNP